MTSLPPPHQKGLDTLESILSRHASLTKDLSSYLNNSDCTVRKMESHTSKPHRNTPKYEVEHQNASLLKRISLLKSEGLDWKKELRKSVTIYRSIIHPPTGKSPAELPLVFRVHR